MLLSGSSELSVDEKGRFAMPARCRQPLSEHCGGVLVFTRSLTDRCLWIYPQKEWEETVSALGALPSVTDALCRTVQRVVLGSAVSLKPDSQWRYVLPPELREAAGLKGRAMLIGFNRKFELWSCEELEAQRRRDEELLKRSLGSFGDHQGLGDLRL